MLPVLLLSGIRYDTSVAWWGLGLTVALVVLGWVFGVRRFRRESR